MIQKKLITPIQKQGATKTGSGTNDHNVLLNREILNQHTINAITGLETSLESKVDKITDQTITGSKTFNADQTISGENQLNFGDQARQWIRYNGTGVECVSLDDKNWDFFVTGNKRVSFTNTGMDLFNTTISNLAAPTTELQATNKKYVDDNFVNKSLGSSNTMEGDLLCKGKLTQINAPVFDADVPNKEYVDSTTVSKTAPNVITGTTAFNGIIIVPEPLDPKHAANKEYIDTNVPLETIYPLTGRKLFNRQIYCYLAQIDILSNTVVVPNLGTEGFVIHYTFARLESGGQWTVIPSLKASANELIISSNGDLRVNIGNKNGYEPNTRVYIEFVYEVDPVTKFNKPWRKE